MFSRMKLQISAILLLVPLVLAESPHFHTLAKILYSDGYVFTESSFAAISYQREASFLHFNLFAYDWTGDHREMLLSTDVFQSMKDAQLSFVVEAITVHDDSPGSDAVDNEYCKRNSSSELRPLIERCGGMVRLRKLRPEERNQMAAFKASWEESEHQLNVQYEEKLLVSQSKQLDKFTLHAPSPNESLNIAAYREPYVSLNVLLEDYTDKRFVVQGPASTSNCDNQPVDGLRVSFCHGRVQISEPAEVSESAKPLIDGDMKIFSDGTKSLNDLDEQELKQLLKAVVARM